MTTHRIILGICFAPALLLLPGIARAQPSITSVENAASNIPPGLPNSAIAQGAMLVVKGSGLGPSAIVVDGAFPLETSLGGTSVSITVAGQQRAGILYYTLDRQVAAILPSSTPVGTGALTVTFNGRTSAPFPVQVVQNNIAIYTLAATGSGPAVATFADSFVAPNNAALPDDVVILWANGLGPVSYAETVAAAGGDQTNVPLEVWLGSQQATILYRGRNACCSSVDTIYIRIPHGVSGCAVPVTMRIGDRVSNTATLPISGDGRICSPSTPGIAQADYQRLLSRTSLSFGIINLSRVTTNANASLPGFPSAGTVSVSDLASARFQKSGSTAATTLGQFADIPAPGTCTVVSFRGQAVSTTAGLNIETVDAGASLALSGPAGNRTLAKNLDGGINYGATVGNGSPGNFFDLGSYSVTVPGAGLIGAATARVAAPAALSWTNRATIGIVDRSLGVTVTWSGADPTGYVSVQGSSSVPSGSQSVGASFTCTASASSGIFSVPPTVLQALPVTSQSPGTLSIQSVTPAAFAASGLDFGIVNFSHSISQAVVFQ